MLGIIDAIDWLVHNSILFIATVPLVFPCPAKAIKTESLGINFVLELL